jgi:uncharacterized protein YdaU (DUF1376 family)
MQPRSVGLTFAIAMAMASTSVAQTQGTGAKTITYTSDEQDSAARRAAYDAEKRAFLEELTGKSLWYKPGGSMRMSFFGAIKVDPRFGIRLESRFTPNVTARFEVKRLIEVPGYTIDKKYVYEIVFEDGRVAYLDPEDVGPSIVTNPRTARSNYITDKPSEAASQYHDKLFSRDPEELLAIKAEEDARAARDEEAQERATAAAERAEAKSRQQKQAAAEREFKRKGGVKVGMTAAQVRASNWGAPSSVNRTTTAGSVHEQWVYAGHNYLYFENGVVTAIQN